MVNKKLLFSTRKQTFLQIWHFVHSFYMSMSIKKLEWDNYTLTKSPLITYNRAVPNSLNLF